MRKIIIKNVLKIIFFLCTIGICFLIISNSSLAAEKENKLYAWGFMRGKDGGQPDFDKKAKEIIENYDGIVVGNENEKNIYITFDLGYEAGYTEKILDVLKKHNVKASFFITGHYLNSAEELVKRMIKEGHIVGNHTVNHKCLAVLKDEEIEKELMDLDRALYNKFNYQMSFFRPPKGEFSENVIEKVSSLGYKTVMWSSAYDDWDNEKQNREEYGINKILNNLHNGAVLLLHATSKDNANILDTVITRIKENGYNIKNIDEFSK